MKASSGWRVLLNADAAVQRKAELLTSEVNKAKSLHSHYQEWLKCVRSACKRSLHPPSPVCVCLPPSSPNWEPVSMATWYRRGLPAGGRNNQSSVGITARNLHNRNTPWVEWKIRTSAIMYVASFFVSYLMQALQHLSHVGEFNFKYINVQKRRCILCAAESLGLFFFSKKKEEIWINSAIVPISWQHNDTPAFIHSHVLYNKLRALLCSGTDLPPIYWYIFSIVSQGEYNGEIKGGLRPSMKLVVMGIINKKPKRLERVNILIYRRILGKYIYTHISRYVRM